MNSDQKYKYGRLTAAFGLIVALLLAVARAGAFEPQTYVIAAFDDLRTADPNLNGSGVRVCVVERSETYENNLPNFDFKPDTAHFLLADADIKIPLEASLFSTATSFHSTAICSILAGRGEFECALTGQMIEYAAPLSAAKIEVREFWEFAVNYLLNIENRLDADVISASFGTALPDWWTRAMEYIVQRDNILAVASIGNGSEFSSCLYPAAGANFLAVGLADRQMLPLSDSYWLQNRADTSGGITFEGLIKPDIVAGGNYLVADGQTGGLTESGNFSSYAAPAVAAIAGLLVQKAREADLEGAYDTDASNCVMKAILMSSAAKGAGWHKGDWCISDDKHSPLDYRQGSGAVDAAAAYNLLADGYMQTQPKPTTQGWSNDVVYGNTENVYRLKTTPQSRYISATLVWNRKYNPQFPFEYLPDENIDLRLELWAIDEKDPNNSILIDYSDSRDGNTEHIFYPVSQNQSDYELVVVFSDTEDAAKTDLSQRYGLAFTQTAMPKQWVGHWLDFDGDGRLTTNDLQGVIEFAVRSGEKDNPEFNTRFMQTVNILLNELAKINAI